VDINNHILGRTLEIAPDKRRNRVISLYNRLSSWFQKEFERENVNFDVNKILWPLKVTIRISSIPSDELSEQLIYKIVREEQNVIMSK
jgi:hypothetical protein